jgi:hypothetical protein
MEWKLPDDKKVQYDRLLKGAQDLEMTIGSTQYRVAKLVDMRKEIDAAIKKWWDETIEQMNLDKSKDYMINREGVITQVEKNAQPAQPTTTTVEQPAPKEDAPAQPTTPGSPVEESKVGTNAADLE